MKTYHGDRTTHGCVVTVDGKPLIPRSDLSGNATTAFDWGYVGGGQLSLALLADHFGDDRKAKAMAEAFEKGVVAVLHRHRWTMTASDMAAALAPLVGVDGERALDNPRGAPVAFVGLPLQAGDTPQARAAPAAGAKNRVADDLVNAANQVADVAWAAAVAAQQTAAHARDKPADEAMNSANRDADKKAYDANLAADKATALAHAAVRDAKRATT